MEAVRVANSLHLVVPCYNEHTRLAVDQIGELTADDRVSLVLVDDGSTDRTLDLLRSIERDTHRVTVIALPRNGGKGEAVRAGLVSSLAANPSWIGYVDADMATPASEILRLLDVAASTPCIDVMIGSRVALLGRDVQRSAFRHYTGRVFATLASVVLSKAVYDTQCGAKLFRRTSAFDRSIAAPFRSRWAFDVELLGRLESAGVEPSRYWEEPLLVWHDVSSSRRTVPQSIGAAAELLPIWRDLRRARR
ncbi:MAG TPA: glycosyltransferase [Ilumatobacter sp.]